MNTTQRVLLASHGTIGAQAAERKALELCGAGGQIYQLIVVPELWKGMTGDDWLNNGSTRDTFRNYLESQLEEEIRENVRRFQAEMADHGIDYSAEVMVGEPVDCLIEASQKEPFDLVVMGSPRPKGVQGLRSRMKPEPLVQALTTPLLVVPYPR